MLFVILSIVFAAFVVLLAEQDLLRDNRDPRVPPQPMPPQPPVPYPYLPMGYPDPWEYYRRRRYRNRLSALVILLLIIIFLLLITF